MQVRVVLRAPYNEWVEATHKLWDNYYVANTVMKKKWPSHLPHDMIITVGGMMAIFAILAVMLLPSLSKARLRAKVSVVLTNLESICSALDRYYADHQSHPESLEDLTILLTIDIFNREGTTYNYRRIDDGWNVYSYGPDEDDDNGNIEYDLTAGYEGNGDIIITNNARWQEKNSEKDR